MPGRKPARVRPSSSGAFQLWSALMVMMSIRTPSIPDTPYNKLYRVLSQAAYSVNLGHRGISHSASDTVPVSDPSPDTSDSGRYPYTVRYAYRAGSN